MPSTKLLTGQLILNWVARILFFTSLSALLPVLPNYLIDIGGNNSQVGLVMSAFAAGVLIFRPLIGKQVDTVGRKIVLIVGVLVFVISPIFYLFIKSIAVLVPVRVFHGLGLAAFGTASITLITDAAPFNKRGEVLSYTGIINTIAFTAGPILGGLIGDKWGFDVVFVWVSIISFACFATALFLKETKTVGPAREDVTYTQAVFKRQILLSFVIILLISMAHGGVVFYIPIFVKENFDLNVGLFFAVFGGATLLIRVFIGRVSDSWGRGPLIVFALLGLSSGVWLLSEAKTVTTLFLAAGIYGFGFGAQQPTLTAMVADHTTEETRGKIFSFYYGGFDLGISMSGILLGAVAESFDLPFMFVICGCLTFSALVAFILFFEGGLVRSLQCAFSFKITGKKCYICDQYQEVPAKQAEEYFKSEPKL